jgi:hypothetical protein
MGLTAAEQREFQQRMERKQMKEFMGVSAFRLSILSAPHPPLFNCRTLCLVMSIL